MLDNSQEDKLQKEIKKTLELEAKLKEAKSRIEKYDVALLSYQKYLDKDKERMSKVIKDYKASDAFQDEVMKALEGAFNYDFLSCKRLIIKLFFDLDLSKVIMEAALTAAAEVTSETTFEVHTTVPPATPTKVPLIEVPISPVEVSVVEVIPMKLFNEDSALTLPANDPQAET